MLVPHIGTSRESTQGTTYQDTIYIFSFSIVIALICTLLTTLFNEKINNSNSVKFIERTDGRKEASFHFKSRKVQDDLISHNVIPRKSLVVKFPLLDDWRMMSHMIRGIIDGNVSISYKAHSISLCSASLEFIVHFTYYMETVLGLSKRKIRVRHDPTGYYSDVYTV